MSALDRTITIIARDSNSNTVETNINLCNATIPGASIQDAAQALNSLTTNTYIDTKVTQTVYVSEL